MGHNKLSFDEVKDYRKVGSFPIRRYLFEGEKVNKIVDFGAEDAVFRELIEKTEKKTRKGGKQRFFCLFWLTKRPAISILAFAPLHFFGSWSVFAPARKAKRKIDSYLIFEEDRRSKNKMKKAIALSSILLLAVVAYGCQGGCGPAPANNTANNTANKTPTPAATPATTPASTNTNTGNANANANKANTSPTKTP